MYRIRAISINEGSNDIIQAAAVYSLEHAEIFGMAVLQVLTKFPISHFELVDEMKRTYRGFFGKNVVGYFSIEVIEVKEQKYKLQSKDANESGNS